MKHLIRECFQGEGYVFATRAAEIARAHGHARPARLASNENPAGPSPEAVRRAVDALGCVNRYPDETNRGFADALRAYHGDYRFVASVGMDGIIETVIRTLINDGDEVVVSTPTYSFYGIAVRAQGGTPVSVARRADWSVDPETFIRACKGRKLAFLCSPNNPTGTVTPVEDIKAILDEIKGILFLDAAYIDFCDEDYRPLMKEYDNLIIGRTMSKAFSLAGLRIGYAFVPTWYEPYYMTAATPFTLNSVSQAAGEGALADPSHTIPIVRNVEVWRGRFAKESPYPVAPSGGNFVLVDVAPATAEEVVEQLAARGVIVRSCTSFPGLGDHYIRVSIGEDWENERFLEEISRL
ncbi:histidinol-phosphate aminotransferase [Methanomicrobiaceae archaeon CYW5]|uniref:pyridoxal phosphate-dependent aminotransferase n=1 Tax=Methanovulcanius yangii TaxID=1789227 RepID=UPI0029C9CC31|nr:histidinol-phosphate transaminase [Methanovulcanius yangii]MBT8508163.1 histidinol-phosphate aminotransferase [Methanovulcanius yangii]